LGTAAKTRKVSLNEAESETVKAIEDSSGNIVEDCTSGEPFAPTMAMLGTVNGSTPIRKMWESPITETPLQGDTEIWEIHNFTEDAHPIHLHQVMFQVIERQPFGGTSRTHEPWESGWKDTLIAYPGEITRLKAKFDLAGRYVWHCHILEHEDNEMMRPLLVFHRINLPFVSK
jgi:bilirubin oxidase